MELDFEVTRRGIDPTAETCAHALRDLLGVAVLGVERAELWRFETGSCTPGERERRCEQLAAAASRAGRYVNPNRDRARWLDGPRPYDPAMPGGGCAVDIWVRDGQGTDPAALQYFRSQVDPHLRQVWRGVLWRLYLEGGDEAAARERALEIAVTRGRREGLLANPHAQTAVVLHVVPGPRGESA